MAETRLSISYRIELGWLSFGFDLLKREIIARSEKRNGYVAGRRRQRSLREIAAELTKLGFVNERGGVFSASSARSMLA